MELPRVVLASASPARLGLLRSVGLPAEPIVSGVAETGYEGQPAATVVLALAEAKARAVASRVGPQPVVIGADSLLELDGVALGKPASAQQARERWAQMSGRRGVLHTGHAVGQGPTFLLAHRSTTVRFATVSECQIAAYVATGEPLGCAGAFAIDGVGAALVEEITGCPSNVIGLSLPLVRGLLADLGWPLHRWWEASRP